MHVSRETVTIEPTPGEISALEPIAIWLAPRAAALGLTTFATARDFLANMMLPAVAYRAWQDLPPTAAVAEFGPGSGGLGLGLAALLPLWTVHLVDRRERVTAFLDLAAHATGLSNVVTETRDLAEAESDAVWDAVVFRALAQPQRALQMAAAHASRQICALHSVDVAYTTGDKRLQLVREIRVTGCPVIASLFVVDPQPPEDDTHG